MHLDVAQKYVQQIKQIREQCKRTRQPLPANPLKPEKVPCLGKLTQTYKEFSQSDSLPMDLFMALVERAKQRNLTEEQCLRYIEICETNYKKLIADKNLKLAQAKAKRAATIAARRNSVGSEIAPKIHTNAM